MQTRRVDVVDHLGAMMPRAVRAGLTALILAVFVAGGANAETSPKVVASIAPIHSLVASVMEGVGEPELIVKGGGSPHSYSLRPSEARALQDADLVVWVGESMETFLAKSIPILASGARVLELSSAPGVTVLPLREGGAWEAHGHEEDDHDDDGDHQHIDGHIWLDPDNAKAIIAAVVKQLSDMDPAHAENYEANGARASGEIEALSADMAQRIAPVAGEPYVVFHDAYQYFERHFGTHAVGSVTISPEKQPGAARIAAIRDRLTSDGVVCVFREPQFSPRVIETIVEGTGVRIGVLDPLGAAITPGPQLYPTLMSALATDLVACLAD